MRRESRKLAANLAAKPSAQPCKSLGSESSTIAVILAHYIDQSHADLSRRDDGFARMGPVAKRSIRNGLQTRAFDSVAVFTIELFVASHHTPSITCRPWCSGEVNETLITVIIAGLAVLIA